MQNCNLLILKICIVRWRYNEYCKISEKGFKEEKVQNSWVKILVKNVVRMLLNHCFSVTYMYVK